MHVGIVSFTDVDSGLDLANAIADTGVRVTFYSSLVHTVRTVGDSNHPVDKMYELGLLGKNIKVQLTQLCRMRDPRSLSVMSLLAKTIQNDGVDIVHILIGGGELWTAVLAKLVRRIPVVSTIIIPKPNIGEFPPPWVVTWVNRLIASGSDAVIVNGKDHVAIMREIYSYPVERVYYIPLGPRSVFRKWCMRDVSEENGTILFLGRINKHKGLEYLIKALPLINEQVPSARIIIAGQGEDLERCRRFIADPNQVEIRDGFIPGEMVAELFQKASVIAIPYLTAATSGILMTAYVFGKPVVATKVGSLPEYVQDGKTGFLVEPGDEKQLADLITRILSDSNLKDQMGRNAALWVEGELGWKNIAMQTMKIYKETMNLYQKIAR
jgi:glycosyltransferase involved in cell wall biosynthesis